MPSIFCILDKLARLDIAIVKVKQILFSLYIVHTGSPYKRRVCFYVRNRMGKSKSLNIVNLYRVMSMLKLKINVNLPLVTCCVLSFLRLKMANLSDLVGFALTVTTRVKKKNHQIAQIHHFEPQK